MVAGEASQESEPDLAQRLVDCYETFLAAETLILRKKFGGKLTRHVCRDVAHEAYMKVAAKVLSGELGPDTNLPAYLRAASRNLATDVVKAQNRVAQLDDAELLPAVPGQGQPFEAIEPMEELVLPQIDAMPLTRHRKVVQFQSQGLSDAQIAETLGITTDRVQKDRHMAVSELRDRLSAHIRDSHRKKTQRGGKDR
ncbi:RNA polymerase sigma factor [Streptomyces sp. NPDC053493]|uniref:RNA polymerase sigma factor n=1 Tax=Streptomyces sp. NPDC053493 TaxID=3365705 RepID=UPI0037CE3930